MIHTHFTFTSEALVDDPEKISSDENVNGFGGHACAVWIGKHLSSLGYSVSEEPIAEDWGWATVIDIGADRFLVGCAPSGDGEPSSWGVIVGDNFNRGLFPATRKRRTEAVSALTATIGAFLQSQPSVTDLKSEPGEG